MLLVIEPAKALQLIESPRQVRKDRIVPMECPVIPNSPYQPEYDWLFRYERQIAGFLEKWLKPFRYELIGEKGILCEALSNSFYHGHNKNPEIPIIVRVLLGQQGLMVQIKDNGPGFGVQQIYKNYLSRKPYYSTAGNGIRWMAESSNFGVFHDTTGTICCLLHLFSNGLTLMKPYMVVS